MEDKTSKKSVGRRIKELRKKKKETQNDLAAVLYTTQNNISKMERGETGLTFNNLIKIAEHYKVSLDYLGKGEGGADLLDTLKQYISFKYDRMTGIDNDNNSHFIPRFEINECLYCYFSQVASASKTPDLPEDLRQRWIEEATKEFNDKIIHDTNSKKHTFIPLDNTVFEEQHDIITKIEKHFAK